MILDNNLTSIILGALAVLGTTITAIFGYLNNRWIKEVKEQTDGMSKRLESAAFKDGQDDGKAQEKAKTPRRAKPKLQ